MKFIPPLTSARSMYSSSAGILNPAITLYAEFKLGSIMRKKFHLLNIPSRRKSPVLAQFFAFFLNNVM
jgi:hypothetical protein